MSTQHKGDMIRDIPDGEMLKDEVVEGERLVSEAPKGDALWKKKKKLNEDGTDEHQLNETFCGRFK